MPTLYVHVPGSTTTATTPVPIPGLSLDIFAGVGEQAVIILNAPQASATATGGNNPGGTFFLSVDGTRLSPSLRFGGSPQSPNGAHVPCTLVGAVPLKPKPQKVQAEYYAERSATVSTGPASLTVMLD